MRRLVAILLGVVLGGATVFAAFQYHLVRTDRRYLFVRKQRADWHDAYVDIRGWTFRDWNQHLELGRNLIAAGHGELVTHSAADEFFRGLFDTFRGPAPADRSGSGPNR